VPSERIDVVGRPRTHTEQRHQNRYRWAATIVAGDILDAACGTGYGAHILSSSGRVVGLDYSEDTLALARQRAPEAEFVLASLPELPLPDDSFDAVVSFETIEHVADPSQTLRAFRRVIRTDGRLLLSTPRADREGAWDNPFHVKEFVLDELTDLLAECGFNTDAAFTQGVAPSHWLQPVALKFVARFPVLCRPDRWWDVLAHGREQLAPYESATGMNIVLLCRATG
jgi:SAM-dependent methyltransferase